MIDTENTTTSTPKPANPVETRHIAMEILTPLYLAQWALDTEPTSPSSASYCIGVARTVLYDCIKQGLMMKYHDTLDVTYAITEMGLQHLQLHRAHTS